MLQYFSNLYSSYYREKEHPVLFQKAHKFLRFTNLCRLLSTFGCQTSYSFLLALLVIMNLFISRQFFMYWILINNVTAG